MGNDDYGRFRREAEDSEWIRILTLLGLSADLYNDLTQENIDKNCPSKLICQALESRDILGFEDSYIRKIYQIFTSQHFTNDDLIHNQLTEENSSCSSKYSDCPLSCRVGHSRRGSDRPMRSSSHRGAIPC